MGERVYKSFHFFCGIGGTKLGEAKARAVVGDVEARFESLGGVDFDAQACRDYERVAGGRALCADVHKLEPGELAAFTGRRRPDAVFMSPPCKGNSRLLSAEKAKQQKYVDMNALMERALLLCFSTWDEPPPLIFVENVPGITTRSKPMLDRCVKSAHAHGYVVDMGTHDCGEIGGLAQHRPRWFAVFRHRTRMAHVIYVPRKQRVRACGEVIGPMPMPGDLDAGGAMHAVPNLSWTNWKRLAAIPAGGDWRDLEGTIAKGQKRREVHRRHAVQSFDEPTPAVTGPGGHAVNAVADPRPYSNIMVVTGWDDPARSVVGASRVGSGALSVADARFGHVDRVTDWEDPVGVITRSPAPSSGAGAVADPRPWWGGVYGVTSFDDAVATVTGRGTISTGRAAVADPRPAGWWQHVAGVTPWDRAAPTVTAGAKIHAGAFQVADPRPFLCSPRAGAYRVLRWDQASGTVTGALGIDNGPAAIADPRIPYAIRWASAEEIALAEAHPNKPPPFIPIILADDGTWHRPLTTLELAALQSLPIVDEHGVPIVLDGRSHTRWRMAIGNAVPPDAATAVVEQFLLALLRSEVGAFALSNERIWVEPIIRPRSAA